MRIEKSERSIALTALLPGLSNPHRFELLGLSALLRCLFADFLCSDFALVPGNH
jgi:hypothetical protein